MDFERQDLEQDSAVFRGTSSWKGSGPPGFGQSWLRPPQIELILGGNREANGVPLGSARRSSMRQLFLDGGLCTVGNGIRTAVSADGAKSVSEVEVGVVSRSAWISNSPS